MGNPDIWKVPPNTIFNCSICDIPLVRNSWTQKYCKPCSEQRTKESMKHAMRRYYYRNRKVVHHNWQVRFLDTYGEIYCINCTIRLRRFDIEERHKGTLAQKCPERTNVSGKNEKT